MYSNVYNFAGGAQGTDPAGLATDGQGNFYGVAGGGTGYGVVYKITVTP